MNYYTAVYGMEWHMYCYISEGELEKVIGSSLYIKLSFMKKGVVFVRDKRFNLLARKK